MPLDTTEPTWAADTNFSSGPRSGEPTKTASADPDQGFVAGSTLAANELNEILSKITLWLADAGRDLYGDGSDGVVTISGGTTTLSRDMYYDDLTITSTGILATAGFRVFVRGTCTIDASGIMSSDGANGANGTTGSVAGGAARSAGTLAATAAGGAGGTETGGAGTAGAAASTSLGGAGGGGGDGRDSLGGSGSGAGAAGGALTAPVTTEGLPHQLIDAIRGRSLSGNTWRGGTGGGGGGGGDGASNNAGGSGGAGGGCGVLAAYLLVNNGTIRARGGNGGNGGTAGFDGGGGGGGGGGVWITIARMRDGSGTISVVGGTHGTSNPAGGNGVDGGTGSTFELWA